MAIYADMINLETLNTISLIWIGLALLLFPVLLRITAPYGRHAKTSWGRMIDNSAGWFIMESPSLVIFTVLFLANGLPSNTVVRIAGLFWVIHYFHRAVIFPVRLKTKGKKMPLAVMFMAVFFNLVNASVNGYWLGYLAPDYESTWLTGLPFIAGVILFVSGFIINQYHDRILIRLRKASTNGYRIPYGGMFRYISCPNHFGEILEWGGFALFTWGLPSLSFFVWTFVNLLPRSLDHHRWYRSHFPDYPKERKAVIPFMI